MNVEIEKDRRNHYGVIICGHFGNPGHGISTYWELNGKPKSIRNMNWNENARPPRKFWICGSTKHLAYNCTKVMKQDDDNEYKDEENDQLNILFMGSIGYEREVLNTKKEEYIRNVDAEEYLKKIIGIKDDGKIDATTYAIFADNNEVYEVEDDKEWEV